MGKVRKTFLMDPEAVEALKRHAKRFGRTLSGELCWTIQEKAAQLKQHDKNERKK